MKDCKEFKYDKNFSIPCMAIGTYGIDEKNLEKIFSSYPYKKIVIDTAYKYENEKEIGNLIYNCFKRENIIYIGKISYEQQKHENVKYALQQTLDNLKTDYIDIYLIHSPRYEQYCSTWRQMIELKKDGYIRHIGVSNFKIKDLEKLYKETNVMPCINQIVMENSNEQHLLIEYCKKKGILVQMARPFGGEENKKNINDIKRSKILQDLYNSGIMSIVGTKNVDHMLKNVQVMK